MDPTETLRALLLNLKAIAETSTDQHDGAYRASAVEALDSLRRWLNKGGFAPDCITEDSGHISIPRRAE